MAADTVSQLAVELGDLAIVCRDGGLVWHAALLAAWSPFLGGLLGQEGAVLVVQDWDRKTVSRGLEMLCRRCVGEEEGVEEAEEVLGFCRALVPSLGGLTRREYCKIEEKYSDTEVKMEVEEELKVDSDVESEGEQNDGPSSDVGSHQEYLPDELSAKYESRSESDNSESDDEYLPRKGKKNIPTSEKVQLKRLKERERKQRQRRNKKYGGASESKKDDTEDKNLKLSKTKSRVKKEPGPRPVKESSWAKVWIKEPSPERFRNGVKTDEFFMSEDVAAKGPPYSCLMCKYSSPHKRYVKLHFQTKHSKERLYKCVECGVPKVSQSGVVAHWQRMHHPNKQEIFKHVCDICGKMYSIPSELKIHKLTHNEATLACKYCGKTFKKEVLRKNHEMRHENEKVPCNICGKVLASAKDARDHELTVHENFFAIDCEVCGQTLKCKSNLKIHMAGVHGTQVKNHHCHICGASFRANGLLQKHVETVHEKSRQFPCPYCTTVLSSKAKFKLHSQRMHKGMELPEELANAVRPNALTKFNTSM